VQFSSAAIQTENPFLLTRRKFPFSWPRALNPMTTPPLAEQIELHRDRMWRRDEELRVESGLRVNGSSKTWALQVR
jgi:hypothetical protein